MSKPETTSVPQIKIGFTLDDMFAEARSLGLVRIHTHDDGDYSATIKFTTINHTSLAATSGYKNASPHEVLHKAIMKAREIRSSFI